MPSAVVAEGLDLVEQRGCELAPSRPAAPVDGVLLQGREERLKGVVLGVVELRRAWSSPRLPADDRPAVSVLHGDQVEPALPDGQVGVVCRYRPGMESRDRRNDRTASAEPLVGMEPGRYAAVRPSGRGALVASAPTTRITRLVQKRVLRRRV